MMNELLDTEPGNSKALFLRGQAFYNLQDIAQAYQNFLLAANIEPGNTSIARYI